MTNKTFVLLTNTLIVLGIALLYTLTQSLWSFLLIFGWSSITYGDKQ